MQIHTLDDRPRGELSLIQKFFDLSSEINQAPSIAWSSTSGNILAVDWHDLQHQYIIPWKDVNIVVTETFQQGVDAIKLFDLSKSYILVTESFAEPSVVKSMLPALKIIKTFTRFVEVFEYGQQLYNPVGQYAWAHDIKREPMHDFFCLVGRESRPRRHLVTLLTMYDLSNSLVKYRGKQLPQSKAPDLDLRSYDPTTFYFLGNTFKATPWLTPAKLIPVEFYRKFYFEIQYETDPYYSEGWQMAEFHLTEKSIKPLIMGVPCLMLGAVGYNTWLKEMFDIDLSLGQFDMSFDHCVDNLSRIKQMVSQIPNLINNKVSLTTQDRHAKNMLGFARLRDFNLQQLRDLYTTVSAL